MVQCWEGAIEHTHMQAIIGILLSVVVAEWRMCSENEDGFFFGGGESRSSSIADGKEVERSWKRGPRKKKKKKTAQEAIKRDSKGKKKKKRSQNWKPWE